MSTDDARDLLVEVGRGTLSERGVMARVSFATSGRPVDPRYSDVAAGLRISAEAQRFAPVRVLQKRSSTVDALPESPVGSADYVTSWPVYGAPKLDTECKPGTGIVNTLSGRRSLAVPIRSPCVVGTGRGARPAEAYHRPPAGRPGRG